MDLPSFDSPDLHLVPATFEEHLAQQHVNSEEWRGALSLEAYLRREEMLFSQELTAKGGLTAWALVYQPDVNGPRQVICGCESQNKRALVSSNGEVRDDTCHAVCSVFCPPTFRRRGYAGRMIAEVAARLKGWQMEKGGNSAFSVLFSDIGKHFYAARGWQPRESAHVSLPAVATQTQPSPPVEVRLLHDSDLPELCALDEALLRKRLAAATKGEQTAVALLPDHRTIKWHHVREDFVSTELYGRSPEEKGALVGSAAGSRVWAYWTRVWTNPSEQSPNTLYILRLVVEDDACSDLWPSSSANVERARGSAVARAMAAILSVAQAQAAEWDMKEVTMWNPTSAAVAAAQSLDASAAVVHREDESITSLLWYGAGRREDINWVCNEKYGWC